MQVEKIVLDREQARELYRQYKKHQHYSEPLDHEIRRAYQLIAQGRMVIRAIESIRAAGLNEQGFPKLAMIRADAQTCFWNPAWRGGGGTFKMFDRWGSDHWRRRNVTVPNWPAVPDRAKNGKAIVPIVPVHLRPKRAIENYHILWEADWQAVPRDPMLLRRIGRGDMWLVVAAWDLTEVERAALATRLSS